MKEVFSFRAVKVGFDPKQIDNSNFLFLYDYLFPVMYRVRGKMFQPYWLPWKRPS